MQCKLLCEVKAPVRGGLYYLIERVNLQFDRILGAEGKRDKAEVQTLG